jgi:hypothetical protein
MAVIRVTCHNTRWLWPPPSRHSVDILHATITRYNIVQQHMRGLGTKATCSKTKYTPCVSWQRRIRAHQLPCGTIIAYDIAPAQGLKVSLGAQRVDLQVTSVSSFVQKGIVMYSTRLPTPMLRGCIAPSMRSKVSRKLLDAMS